MKNTYQIILILILVWVGCATPTPADFKHNNTAPLAENEFITIWRFPAKGSNAECLDSTKSHFQELDTQMQPLFEQLIPQIFSDIKKKNITLHQDKEGAYSSINMEENPIEDVLAKMQQKRYFSADWNNLESFKMVLQITQRRKDNHVGFLAEELKMELVSYDLSKQWPERKFGFLFMEDVLRQNYKIKFEGKKYDLLTYLEKVQKYAYPISFQKGKSSNGLSSLKEAFGTKEYVLSGRFTEIEWLGFEANTTEYSHKPLLDSELKKMAGIYLFQPNKNTPLIKSSSPIEVSIILEGDHLKVTWPDLHQYYQYRVFPTENDRFFTVSNDLIQFKKLDEGGIECIIKHDNGTIIKGVRD